MRIKCRGYEGNILTMEAAETDPRFTSEYTVDWYDVTIRSDDGAKIELSYVEEPEIEVINGRRALNGTRRGD